MTLPEGSAFALCEKIREANNPVLIIFLTASDEETSVIRGLECCGDDYITKSFKLGGIVFPPPGAATVQSVVSRISSAQHMVWFGFLSSSTTSIFGIWGLHFGFYSIRL